MSRLARLQLGDAVKPLLPRAWKIVTSSRGVDDVGTTLVQFRQTEISRLSVAGGRSLAVSFLAMITAPQKTTQAAEDRLDDDVLTFLGALTRAGIMWSDCSKVRTSDDKQLAYDITITIKADIT